MKILFLANRIPFPPYRGDKLKIYNLAKRLCSKHEIHLLTFTQTEEDKSYIQELEKIFNSVTTIHLPKWKSALNCLSAFWNPMPVQVLYFRSAEMQKAINQIVADNSFDAIHVQHLRMSPYLSNRKDLKRILDLPDAYSLYWERRKKIKRGKLQAMFENMEQARVLKYESVINDYNLTLVCSQEDKEYLETTHQTNKVRLLPNGVDLSTFRALEHDYEHQHTLLFTGNMDYAPNVDAVVYFVNEILPIIHQIYPDTKFVIAGQRPIPKVKALANDRVVITGFVKDLSVVYNNASVVVAPLRFGAGTQNKVLEAMAMGVPVVCSHIGFKGLGINSGDGAIMQTDKDAFAQSVIELLSSASLRKTVGQKGKQVINEKFDWDAVSILLEQYLQDVAKSTS